MMRLPKFEYGVPRISALVLLLVCLALWLVGITMRSGAAAEQDGPVGAVIHVPDGYMRVPMAGFNGTMMIDPKKAAGMFVTFPEDSEASDTLRERVLKFVAPMFIH